MNDCIPNNPYLLLTPGPLSTSKGVRGALLRDWCTWDEDYNLGVVQDIRARLVAMAAPGHEQDYTCVLMQGSGSFGVESCLGTSMPMNAEVLILTNGAYGDRMVEMCTRMGRKVHTLQYTETRRPQAEELRRALDTHKGISHVALVHCETTTGILNPLEELAAVVNECGRVLIVDAMSSFGGIPIDMYALGIDYLISSSNKCIQGVPGFSFVLARRGALESCMGNAHSLSLDLYDQWQIMDKSGKWRFTSPTHVVRAFQQALDELDAEGGVAARHERYRKNHEALVGGMRKAGFTPLLPDEVQSPIITSFLYPAEDFSFPEFYGLLKEQGFVLYPGKISEHDTFRIGNIGEVYPADMRRLAAAVKQLRVRV